MGCHGIAFCYWFLGRPKVESVYCQLGTYVHKDKTIGDDETIGIIEFANGAVGVVENSWARRGGMDDRIEVYRRCRRFLRQSAHGQRAADLQRTRLSDMR